MLSAIKKAIKSINKSEGSTDLEAEFCFSINDPIFTGHFPGMPIIPAVYQVGLCKRVIEQEAQYKFAGIIKSRFSKMCIPGTTYNVKISMTKKENGDESVCSIYENAGKVLCSKIVLLFTDRTK
jgi:3-hydroxymyristoyl/3-hydroxydecanoyl-(acyl carrier protein) dehydratase